VNLEIGELEYKSVNRKMGHPAHGSATGRKRKDVKLTLTGAVWWVALKEALP
jgi:hypothetical protein